MRQKTTVLLIVGIAVVALIGAVIITNPVPTGNDQSPENDGATDTSPAQKADGTEDAENWRQIELTDVRTEEQFTINQFDKPVIMETFAVWCPVCTQQQKEIQQLHDQIGDAVVSVSLNVDPNEKKQKVLAHTKEHGFEWRYAVAPRKMTKSLVDTFGAEISAAPQAPVVLACENGSRLMPSGLKRVNTLKSEIEKGC